ncbi:MAG: nif-specific transcriptional activator NifA [Magnetococcales bacterium]|nr:nif-specific transcriptional activator NifA [Magnetococcales bacterium]
MELLEPLADAVAPPVHPALATRQLGALFHVSHILSQSTNPRTTLRGVVESLKEHAGLHHGVITLVDPRTSELYVHAVQGAADSGRGVRYRPGEGILGLILEAGRILMVRRVSEEPRFLNRLGLLEAERPFIGVPIHVGEGELAGVLVAQPEQDDADLLPYQARFMEMVAHLMVQNIILARRVEQEREELVAQRDRLIQEVRQRYTLDNMVGDSPAMRQVYDLVRLVAKWDTTVLIRGESGTGKELIAHAIHYNSPRVRQPLVKLNCAALPDSLLESELFGHEKGAFTGAATTRKGRFELAHGGTLFLDELGEISPSFQAKLLRVLQEGEFERVGGENPIRVNVRIVAATNRHLEKAVADGSFRSDLYYRLNVMAIEVPSLRERREDIPDLSRFLTAKMAKRQGRDLKLADDAIRLLMHYHWPGNVRELENCLERAAVMSPRGLIEARHILLPSQSPAVLPPPPPLEEETELAELSDQEMAGERERVVSALRKAGWVKAKAARLLGLTPRQVAYRVKILGIATESF